MKKKATRRETLAIMGTAGLAVLVGCNSDENVGTDNASGGAGSGGTGTGTGGTGGTGTGGAAGSGMGGTGGAGTGGSAGAGTGGAGGAGTGGSGGAGTGGSAGAGTGGAGGAGTGGAGGAGSGGTGGAGGSGGAGAGGSGGGGAGGMGGSGGSGGEGDDICKPAIPQLEGPYPQDCPERSDLNIYGHDAVALRFVGKVFDENCEPVVDAKVLIWHSCPSSSGGDARPASQDVQDPGYSSAVYDVGTGDMVGKMTPDGQTVPTGDKMYYGWVRTNDKGEFAFNTVRPGYYWDNLAPTNRYRCQHIHAKVFINDNEVLNTQLYFPDDPFNPKDPLYADCKGKGDCMLRDKGGTAVFNFQV